VPEISRGDVQHLESLAALRLSEADRERLRGHLQRILEYMQQLAAVDVRDVPPTYHVIEAEAMLREDRVRPSLPPDAALANAPDARRSFYRVPRFLGDAEAGP
jgi:aspartyl-tRNA(Asn)/glutamyl-tRNA(Gln) amidotransferase subunit C